MKPVVPTVAHDTLGRQTLARDYAGYPSYVLLLLCDPFLSHSRDPLCTASMLLSDWEAITGEALR